jgi:hypothetical protein
VKRQQERKEKKHGKMKKENGRNREINKNKPK